MNYEFSAQCSRYIIGQSRYFRTLVFARKKPGEKKRGELPGWKDIKLRRDAEQVAKEIDCGNNP